jgi:hypothetical protein
MKPGTTAREQWPGYSFRQVSLVLLAALLGFVAALQFLVPGLLDDMLAGRIAAAAAVRRAATMTGTACFGTATVVAVACEIHNRIRFLRARREAQASREIAFLTSLGSRQDED